MKYKVGDRVKVKSEYDFYEEYRGKQFVIEEYDSSDDTYLCHPTTGGYKIWFSEEKIEPVTPTLAEIKEKKLTCVVHAKTKREADMLFKAVDSYDHNGKTWASWWDVYKEKTCYRTDLGEVVAYGCIDNYIEDGEKVIEFSDLVATGGTISIHDLQTDALSALATNVQLDKETVFNGLSQVLKRATEVYSSTKEEKNLKFTFYVTDWVDINKTNGEKIPMKRTVAYIGSNTDVEADTSCPVAEYDERIGCLIAAAKISTKRSTEAKMMYNIARSTWGTELSWAILFELANAAFNDNFERAYKKFHNDNIRFEKKRLTCNFCGKIFKTIEEKTKHENEHIQNKKNKREKYLIRKEAKRRLAEAEREGKIEQTMKELYKK